jgi:uncharacterized protein
MMEQLVEFKVRDQKIAGVLHTPITQHPPAIIMCHGFAMDKNEKGLFVKTAEELCKNGFLVLRFDFRGHGDSLGSLDKATVGTMLEDFQTAFQKVGNLEINKNKIGVLTASFGSVPVILSGDQKIQTFVMWNPIVRPNEDMRKVFDAHCDKGWDKDIMENKFIPYKGKRVTWEFWDQIRMMDMTKEIRDIRCPTCIIYGTHDEYVSIRNTRDLFWAASEPREKVQVSSNHGLHEAPEETIEQTVKWFLKWLM